MNILLIFQSQISTFIKKMIKKKHIICIIPARGGSKGIQNKNIINFMGKPLLTYSINYAKKSTLISNIYVSTDNDKISKVASDNNTNIINRPKSISGDTATTESAISHLLENLTDKPDIIVLLQATSPLRPEKNIDSIINKFIKNKYDSLLSLSPSHRFFWEINNKEAIPKYDFLNRPRRQDIEESDKKFVENGSLYIFTYESFKKNNNRLGGKIGYVVFDEEFSYEIDSYADLLFLEELAKHIKSKND